MSGYSSDFMNHDCERDGCFFEGSMKWNDIIARFPRSIRPTDIDGMVEINGHFLFLEEKRCEVVPKNGQRLAFKALSRNPRTTVLFFRPGIKSEMQTLIFKGGETEGWKDCTRNQFLHWIERWAVHANESGRAAS